MIIKYEIWEDDDGPTVFPADSKTKMLHTNATLIKEFYADTHDEAMQIYNDLYGFGKYDCGGLCEEHFKPKD